MAIWQREIITFLLLFLVVCVVGLFTKLFLPLLFALTFFSLCRHLYQIHRFEKWLRTGGQSDYPKTTGVWEEIYYHVYRIRKNNKRRKKKLSKMVDQFRQSTEALPDAAVVLNATDEIEWANKAARDVLGLKQSDKGQRIPNLIRFPEFIQYLKSKQYDEPVVLPSPINNQITLAVRIINYGAGLRLLLAQDVTQLKQMERMRKDFVANVSHELRTPLTVIKGYLETFQDLDSGTSSLLTTSLKNMLGQTDRMQYLVDDLLLLAHLETKSKMHELVNIPALLTQICHENEAILGEGRIQLTLDSDAQLVGEEHELRSAFTNLLGNALKYSPENTPVQIHWHQTPDGLLLDIIDQGEGISEADVSRVTERFYRVETKRSKKINGTGLGLAIVKHVLMRHDAQLIIRSELGKGSCFQCVFPLKRLSVND
ncbi:MAG: phosphate regulon sensor histidine kinase PhoR [Methylococcales bacterium]|nr:phosphate regulon sensor histidine kinase PhoR [Methylococcales bacterium]